MPLLLGFVNLALPVKRNLAALLVKQCHVERSRADALERWNNIPSPKLTSSTPVFGTSTRCSRRNDTESKARQLHDSAGFKRIGYLATKD
jgi:hypothetical protein